MMTNPGIAAGTDNEDRFMLELEFLSLLSNPKYLHYLAQNKYLEDPAFLNFLRYLRYWKRSEYLIFVAFPQALQILDALVDQETFRENLKLSHFVEALHEQIHSHWILGPSTRNDKCDY